MNTTIRIAWLCVALSQSANLLLAHETPAAKAPPTPAATVAQPRRVYAVAVLDFECKLPERKELGAQLGSLLTAHLSAQEHVILVERQELDAVLSEQELGISGTVQPDTAALIGHITGAKVLVTGRVLGAGDEVLVVAKVIGTETSRVFAETVRIGHNGDASAAGEELAAKIATAISKNGTELLAKSEPRHDTIRRLRESLVEKRLPALSIRIPERHLPRPGLDPAAEIEITSLLLDLGFSVTQPAGSTPAAEIEIVGEAFSEFASRRGNLVSCRGRVEVKAIQRATGRILFAGRQTEVAVDSSEQVAGRMALQHAASKLVERMAVKLAQP